MIKKVTIFCSSSEKVDQKYFDDAISLTKILVENEIDIVCGGGSTGLMRAVIDTAYSLNRINVIGIRPIFLNNIEKGNTKLTELILVESMNERILKMIENTDAVITLPGGSGTFEELFSILTLKRIGKILCPIILLNSKNYFNPFLSLFRIMVKENFMHKIHRQMFEVISEPNEILKSINNSFRWEKSFNEFVVIK
jgi:uncharacterized protein (TIGR00730 family)